MPRPHNDEFVRIHGRTSYQAATAVGTLTTGAYVQLTVAANSSAIFGAEIATLSTVFSRYKVEKLGVRVCSPLNSSTNRYYGVKYVPEDAATPGTVTALSLLDGPLSAVRCDPEVLPAELILRSGDLDVSGILWRECDQTSENTGSYGELTVINENSSSPVFVTFDWTIVFAGMGYSGFHAIPPKNLRGLNAKQLASLAAFYRSPSALVPLGSGAIRKDASPPKVVRDDEWETVSVLRRKT